MRAIVVVALGALWGQAPAPVEDHLVQARQAYAKRDFKAAAQGYQAFLSKASDHAQAGLARYGLGLTLLQSPEREFAKAAELLEQAADDARFADRPAAHYWAAVASRLGASPGAADAAARLDRAARRFRQAAEAYAAAAPGVPDAGDKELPAPLEASLRARGDEAETLLAAGKVKEAAAAADALSKDRGLPRSRWREPAWYVIGCAAYAADDPVSAARALARLAPFEQPLYGTHARYLLGRVHHRAGDTTEAQDHYGAVPEAFARHVLAAKKSLTAESVRDNPLERARLEALANGPAPEYVADALYFSAALFYDRRQYAEAADRLAKIGQQFPRHPRELPARVLLGACLVQLGRHAEAVRSLQPLVPHAEYGMQARAWLAKALVRGADPAQAAAAKQALDQAADHFRQAAGHLARRPETAPEAADLLLELADALRRAGRPADAATVYEQLAGTAHAETARARLVACHQSSGKYRDAESAFARFEKEHPRSALMPEALFSYAETAFAEARTGGELAKPLFEEAVRRYQKLIEKYPDLPQASLCRYRLAMACHAVGKYAEAAAALGAISEPDRGGAMAASSYVLADSLLRAGPTADQARDAVTAGRRLQQLNLAIQALQAFLAAQATAPEAPEAMMKLGYCHQQIAALQAAPEERAKAARAAVQTYEALRAQFPEHPLRPVAEYERANSLALAGDVPTALSKFPRFRAPPFANAPIAPWALLREAQLLRQLGRAAEAANVLAQCRAKYEEALKKDPARADWVPLIRYHHGLALKEAKQPAEAKKHFESVLKDYPQSELAKASREQMEDIKP
jgi:TolA-binding protein